MCLDVCAHCVLFNPGKLCVTALLLDKTLVLLPSGALGK